MASLAWGSPTEGVFKTPGTNALTGSLVIPSGKSLAASGSGTIAATSAPASALTGDTLPSNVTASSLTSLGTLTSLVATGDITLPGLYQTINNPSPGNLTLNTPAGLEIVGDVYLDNVLTVLANIVAYGDIGADGNINAGGFLGGHTCILSATTGTAPLTVASTTRVANLNVATAGTADALTTARAINGVSFNGSAGITVPAAAGTLTGPTLASGVTASSLTSFGSSIVLGTPASGTLTNCTFPTLNQNTTGSAATLTTPRTINGVSFNGSADITVPADAGTLTGTALNFGGSSINLNESFACSLVVHGTGDNFSIFLADGLDISGANPNVHTAGDISANGAIQAGGDITSGNQVACQTLLTDTIGGWDGFTVDGSALTNVAAATLATPRTINGVSFNGSADIEVPIYNAHASHATSFTALPGVNVFTGSTASQTITLPSPTAPGEIKIKNQSSVSVTVASAAGSQIYTAALQASVTLTAGSSMLLWSDGTYWNQ